MAEATATDGAIYLGGEMEIPTASADAAWAEADRIADLCGYLARRVKRGDLRGVQVWLAEGPSKVAWWDAGGRFAGVEVVGK